MKFGKRFLVCSVVLGLTLALYLTYVVTTASACSMCVDTR